MGQDARDDTLRGAPARAPERVNGGDTRNRNRQDSAIRRGTIISVALLVLAGALVALTHTAHGGSAYPAATATSMVTAAAGSAHDSGVILNDANDNNASCDSHPKVGGKSDRDSLNYAISHENADHDAHGYADRDADGYADPTPTDTPASTALR